MYWVRIPGWLRRLFPADYLWQMQAEKDPAVYLTFDDGPHPQATTYALDQLARFEAKATFFCIGKNVDAHPDIYQRMLAEGHGTGNHTHNHLNGWKTQDDAYLANAATAAERISSRLFRPPYGRIRRRQAARLRAQGYQIVMWDVLSGDFDTELSPEQCLQHVLSHIRPGSIVVFHDSQKAWPRLEYALPRTLAWCRGQGWQMKALPQPGL